MTSKVILGESKEGSKDSIKALLVNHNVELYTCDDGIEAIRMTFEKSPDVIFLDVSFPRLSGNQVARILKNDPSTNTIPIILMGSSGEPISRYWSRVCGGDEYLQKPINQMELERVLQRYGGKDTVKSPLLSPTSSIPNLDDYGILNVVSTILEKELLRAKILNELNMIDIYRLSTHDIIMAIMTMFESLYSFSLGAALLLYDHYGHIYFYQKKQVEKERLEKVKGLILGHLQRQHKIFIHPKHLEQTLLLSSTGQYTIKEDTDAVYIFAEDNSRLCSVLAFENSEFGPPDEEAQEILSLAKNVIEKKILFERVQELSIIDAVTGHGSMAYFMACLNREMASSIRNGYPITLMTIVVSNFHEIIKKFDSPEIAHLISVIENLILEVVRKSDIVARYEMASFAILHPGASIEKANEAKKRICAHLTDNLTAHLDLEIHLSLETGICQFAQEIHESGENFFANAQPQKSFQQEG
ncbi:MAG: diguanylate cyclase domain-containing protein [bacterium]